MRAAVCTALLTLAACTPQDSLGGYQPYEIATPFDDRDFSPWAEPGQARLDGTASLVAVDGTAKSCAGQPVYLMPATLYNQEVIGAGDVAFADRDRRANRYLKATRCDRDGHFYFYGLAPLHWIVLADVHWGVPASYGVQHRGGVLQREIALGTGLNQVALGPRDLVF